MKSRKTKNVLVLSLAAFALTTMSAFAETSQLHTLDHELLCDVKTQSEAEHKAVEASWSSNVRREFQEPKAELL